MGLGMSISSLRVWRVLNGNASNEVVAMRYIRVNIRFVRGKVKLMSWFKS